MEPCWNAATDTSRSSGQGWWWWVSPNSGCAAFEEFLDGVGGYVRRRLPRQVLVLGDFNAHSTEWENARTNDALSNWAAGLGLLLVNRGSTSTCVAWRGSSIVDITWASPDAFRRISGWRVAQGVETLSDHLYIFMDVDTPGPRTATAGDGRGPPRKGSARPPPRWKVKEVNGDLLRAAAIATAWSWEALTTTNETDVVEKAENLRRAMTAICYASMPRATPGTVRSRAVYWWNPDIAELRTRCVRTRRQYLRARHWQRRDEEEVSLRYRAYRVLRRSLQKEIKNAKDRAWSELIETVEADPWGRPYRTVTRKLRAKGPLATMDMEPALLLRIIATLFPRKKIGRQNGRGKRYGRWNGEMTGKSQRKRYGRRPEECPYATWRQARTESRVGSGGSDGSHGPQTSAPLHKMPERGSLPPGMADGEAGLAP
ncbi:uncharacterized protein LOC117212565 [Bombus bifarius]|uniref:Uncharacterized protein LOC117212565 n=1 Tax=Bombus bifarius TaxID=103933 RepID=A0A6P8MY64_9HYME|nr:uncharacterized protein LOC117212565 [Bombus bifarius]